MIVTSWQERFMITRTRTHCRDVGALSLEPTHQQGMQRSYETYSSRTWPFCQSNCTLVGPGHRNDKSYLFWPNYRHKRRSFVRVELPAAMFSFPSCIALDSFMICLAKTTVQTRPFKHSVLNTSCRVIDNDVDINPVSYWNENKIKSFLTMCKQWHVSCKQPTHGAFFRVVNRLFSTIGDQLPLAPDVCTSNQKIVLKLYDHHLNRRSNSRESR